MTTRRNARRRLLPFATATPTSRPRSRVKEARGKRSETKHQLNVQTLEKRELLAVDLVSISADVTEQFDVATVNRLSTAPSQLTFRFDGDAEIDPASLSAFQFTAAGGDGTFGDGNETVIEPGFIGLGSSDRIVIARFAETLPDDLYRVEISADPINGLRDVDGGLLTAEVDVLFDVEVGPRVLAVVPQPILGGVGSRIFANDQIQVFFNNDPLSRVSAGAIDSTSSNLPVVNPENYKLILTRDTIEPTLPANVGDPVDPNDDVTIPTRVDYDPVRNLATLTFGAPLSSIAGGDGTFRLRIGSNNALPMPPSEIAVTEFNAGVSDNTFAGAQNQGAGAARFVAGGGIQSLLFTGGEIESTGQYVMAWPGAYDTPGVRDQRRDSKVTRNDDTTIGINIFPYNFAELYGTDPQGNLLSNAITPAQKQRIRETLDLYEEHLGVQFVETEDAGLQFVTGDLRGIQQTADTGAGDGTPMSLYRINEVDPSRGVLVLDAGEPFYDGYGISPDDRPSYFVEAIRGVGNVLGIGDLFELPGGTDGAVGSQDEPNSELFSNDGDGGLPGTAGFPDVPAEPDFLSHAAQVIGKAIHRPESSDVDFYAFEVDPPTGGGEIAGSVTIETFAQRLDESSLLDTQLQLYRVNGPVGSEQYELVARNDDSFGHDSLVKLDLAPGKYVVGVSAKGNDNYNGQIDGSGIDGRSEGAYELRVTFENVETAGSGNPSSITDLSGTLLDGDADGVAGGDFNFWFRVAPDSLGGGARTIFVSKDADGSAAGVGTLASPLDTIEAALDIAEPDDIIRLLPSSGADGDLTTVLDNNAYELGRGGPNNLVLSDGEVLEVPQGVTVMIDAGAILKLRDSKIIAGSDSVDDDRSLASIQVLGTPENSVVFTSYNDQTFGVDTNPTSTTPQAGDWGGIEFRSDVDLAEGRGTYAEEGIFVNYVSHADIRFGGGRVDQAATSTSPIKLTQARPSLIYNTISNSADAAISADPDSFREDNFHAPRYQRVTPFTSDYQRVGPDLAGNILRDNSINALSIRVETEPGEQLEVLSVSGRLDDTDITHTLSQTLTIAGNPGGPELLEDRPDVLAVTLGPRIGGGLNPGVYEYVLSYVTVEGSESLISLPTRQVDLAGGGSVELANLPPAPEEFAGRRLYRGRVGGGMMQYELVTTLDGSSSRYLDTGELRGGIAASATRPAVNMMMPPVAGSGGGQLQRDLVYDYRFTFLDVFGGESPASEPTVSTIALQDGTITLSDIPQPPADDDRFLGTHVYRLNPTTGRYIRIETLREGETDFVDIGLNPADFPGSLLGQELGSDADGGSRLLPRFDARLTIDPGIVLKFDTSRIEATFGADFYAEGVAGKPIHFTSLADDTVGAGGTFDASSNNDDVVATAGDWGGIMLRQGVTGSLDFVEQRYAGGVGSIEGGLADFNPLEILQADVRVTNSVFQFNADGVDPNTDAQDIRVGRGSNTAATIFVRGAQPILIGNIIDDGTGAAISINPDALTDEAISDRGRSTGAADQFVGRLANQGPLIQENQINAHAINGLEIRGEIVTRDTVWDDTGITHVVEEPIYSLTGSFGGALRLRSAVNQSLVVKFG
ncbi:MAG: peptidase, partial [Planctomycetota bacterium]